MLLRSLLAFFMLFLCGGGLEAQTVHSCRLLFRPLFGKEELKPEDGIYGLSNGDSVSLTGLRWYISRIELLQGNSIVWREKNSYHLLDASDPSSLSILLGLPAGIQFDQLRFSLGIDSATNVSGALGGDLDPTKGMYWTWQSGYINLKLEGSSRLCASRDHQFQFHLGGYQYPFSALQRVSLRTTERESLQISLDLKALMEGIDLSRTTHIMSPGKEAVLLAAKAARIFSIDR